MTWVAPDVQRMDEPSTGDERALLEAWLDYHRQTLLSKCAGLSVEQLRTRSVEPSNLSLLGLVRHMADVELAWFRERFGAEVLPELFCTEAHPDADFDDVDTADAAADFASFAEQIAGAKAAASGRSLDDTFFHTRRGVTLTLRWVYLHMIEEYARHNGHADLLRERLDGTVGD
jgi:uncharacterized damage-inducible protein DinB